MPIPRHVTQLNTRLEFDLNNPSFHPVEGPGRNSDVPSLIPPLTENSKIYCSDCHTFEGAPGGPHGSEYQWILKAEYQTSEYVTESPQAYALCYSCHSRTSILNDEGFEEHEKHILKEDAPCSACHDPHGISHLEGGGTGDHTHLINFDVSYVLPEPDDDSLAFIDYNPNNPTIKAGECWLSCHGTDHQPEEYP